MQTPQASIYTSRRRDIHKDLREEIEFLEVFDKRCRGQDRRRYAECTRVFCWFGLFCRIMAHFPRKRGRQFPELRDEEIARIDQEYSEQLQPSYSRKTAQGDEVMQQRV